MTSVIRGNDNFDSAGIVEGTAKAWVNFAGADGTIADSFGVSSVTDSGTGAYKVNFSTPFATVNYSVSGNTRRASSGTLRGVFLIQNTTGLETDGANVITLASDVSTLVDCQEVTFMAFGDQ